MKAVPPGPKSALMGLFAIAPALAAGAFVCGFGFSLVAVFFDLGQASGFSLVRLITGVDFHE